MYCIVMPIFTDSHSYAEGCILMIVRYDL